MAEALISASLSSGISPKNIIATDTRSSRLRYIKKRFEVNTEKNNIAAVKNSEVVFLCVKPQQFEGLLDEIKNHIGENHLFISIAAGITIKFIESKLGCSRVVRTMPNTPLIVGAGVVCYSHGKDVKKSDLDLLNKILGKSAVILRVDEQLMNAVTAFSGSGPAYIFYIAEIMLKAAKKMGLDEKISRTLVYRVIKGSSEMLLKTDKAPEVLRDAVTSPGGTTAAAFKHLSEKKFKEILLEAIFKAEKRAGELSK